MATRKKTTAAKRTPVKATKHEKDTRTNIPTAELEKFAEEDEKKPTKLLYPRDPSLDPQLVWKGKDEQDASDLEVPAVPIYIQETIEPRALIEDLRRRSKEQSPDDQLELFGDSFGDLEFEDRVDFYQHAGKWTNRMILGDSLLVMASLAEKEGLKGQVQMIYIDPPYGIRFESNWQVSTRKREIQDGRAIDATRQPEQVRAFRDTWELGIHSYLAYLRDRLVIARELLTNTGSVFVQIGDENVHLVRAVMDEVFGSECHVVTILVKKKGAQKSSLIDPVNDYLLWYSKSARRDLGDTVRFRSLWEPRKLDSDTLGEFRIVELPDGHAQPLAKLPKPDGSEADYRLQPASLFTDYPGARLFRPWPITNGGHRANQMDPITLNGRAFVPPKDRCWSHTSRSTSGLPGMEKVKLSGRLIASGTSLDFKRYLDDFPFKVMSNWWDGLGGAADPVYVVQTNTEIIKRCVLMTTDPGDLVLDPTGGSGSTAIVAEQWGRRWILADTSRVALALARARLMTTRYPYYLLADSIGGSSKEAELSGQVPTASTYGGDVMKGFVCRRAARITSGSIANNPDIKEGMTRVEIDEAIARHADTEILYDRPYEDRKVVRVTGPFTVESLSPHRVNIDGPEDAPATAEALGVDSARFVERIIEELRAAGVQNTYEGEKLVFDTLEPFAGVYVQATGTYREDGKPLTAAVALGPEYGTVGKELVREAAKEAAEFADILIVCGFAFEALVTDESKVGKLRVLKAKMNPDLQMPDLLKKTGAGNLFMVFGEPDIEVTQGEDDTVTVRIHGLDVYDPTSGEVRSGSTDDIACWFIDTDYNGEALPRLLPGRRRPL